MPDEFRTGDTVRVLRVPADVSAASAEEIRDRILAAVGDFRGDLPMEDDMTLIVIKAV